MRSRRFIGASSNSRASIARSVGLIAGVNSICARTVALEVDAGRDLDQLEPAAVGQPEHAALGDVEHALATLRARARR